MATVNQKGQSAGLRQEAASCAHTCGMFALLAASRRHAASPQSLVFLGEPGVEGGQNNPDYMFTTHDDHDEFGVASPGAPALRDAPHARTPPQNHALRSLEIMHSCAMNGCVGCSVSGRQRADVKGDWQATTTLWSSAQATEIR